MKSSVPVACHLPAASSGDLRSKTRSPPANESKFISTVSPRGNDTVWAALAFNSSEPLSPSATGFVQSGSASCAL